MIQFALVEQDDRHRWSGGNLLLHTASVGKKEEYGMGFRGHVRNNVVVLEPGVSLPDGTEVTVEPISARADTAAEGSLLERLGDLVGSAPGPEDLAENHDHYIHGAAKR